LLDGSEDGAVAVRPTGVIPAVAKLPVALQGTVHQFLDTRIDLGLDHIRGTQDRRPAAAESGERMRHQTLLVLHREREPHAVRLPLGNIEQPRAQVGSPGAYRE